MTRPGTRLAVSVLLLTTLVGCTARPAGPPNHRLAENRSRIDTVPQPNLSEATVLGKASLDELTIGQCTDYIPGAEVPEEGVAALVCSGAHLSEVFATPDLGDGTYPGAKRLGEIADGACMAAFGHATGTSYDRSDFTYGWNTPGEHRWRAEGENLAQCMLFAPDLGPLKGSALDTAAVSGR